MIDSKYDYEKRGHHRQGVSTWVNASTNHGEANGRTVDLSVTGAALDIDIAVDVGEEVKLDIKDIGNLRARVIRPVSGILAVDLGDRDTRRLNDFIDRIENLRYG